jgi:hypothetical protein
MAEAVHFELKGTITASCRELSYRRSVTSAFDAVIDHAHRNWRSTAS